VCVLFISAAFVDNEDDGPLLSHKSRLYVALENGRYKEARKLLRSKTEAFLIKCFENYEGCSSPSYKSSLHLIAALKDEDQAVILCKELLNRVQETQKRENLLNATVVEEFTRGAQTIRARVAAIHIAAYNGNTGVVRLLCQEYGVHADCSTSETLEEPPLKGITPLYWAAVKGQRELVKLLIDSTDDGLNAKCTEDGDTPLYVAAQNEHIEVVKLLLDHKADMDASRHTDGTTPLFIAARNKHTEVVKLLLDYKANVNASRHTGATPLYIAAQYGHTEVVELLLDQAADVNTSMQAELDTPLHAAARNGHTEVVKLLLDHKAEVSASRNTGATPLFVAAQCGHTEVVKLLLEHKADVNASRNTGATPLYIAARNEHTEIVKLLLGHKADANASRHTDGATPLSVATQKGFREVIKLLLDHQTSGPSSPHLAQPCPGGC